MYKLFACSLITTAVGPAGQLDKRRYAAAIQSRLFGNRLPKGTPGNRYQRKGVRRHPSLSSLAMSPRLAFKLPEPCHSARPPGYYAVSGWPGAVTDVTVCPRPWSQSGNQALLGPMPATAGQCWSALPRLPSICCRCESGLKPLKS